MFWRRKQNTNLSFKSAGTQEINAHVYTEPIESETDQHNYAQLNETAGDKPTPEGDEYSYPAIPYKETEDYGYIIPDAYERPAITNEYMSMRSVLPQKI